MSRSIIEVTNTSSYPVSVVNPGSKYGLGHIDILSAASGIASGASKIQAATIGDPGGGHHANTGYIKITQSNPTVPDKDKDENYAIVFIKKVSRHNIEAETEVKGGAIKFSIDYSNPGQSGDPDYHGILITVS